MAGTESFETGQIWTFRGASPASSRVIIGAVDNFDRENQPIISISITNAPIPNAGKELQTVAHLPVAANVLRESVIELEGAGPVPEGFGGGYSRWRQAYDSKKAGYFTIPVKEIVDILRTQLGQQPAAN